MFIYYTDTHSFAVRHRKNILSLAKDMADQLGYKDIHDLVMSFKCVNNDDNDYENLCKYIAGSPCQPSIVTNAMAWFAAEEVCRMFEN
jgi:prophage antirepressor-like protein